MTSLHVDAVQAHLDLTPQAAAPRCDVVPGVSFHPAVAAWFETRFPEGPTPPQVNGWPHIAAGRSTLIAAPTGSGKTLAGFLMCINDLYLAHAAGQPTAGARVVYVSPLKALAVDIAENLQRPLEEIAEIASAMGLSSPDITVGVRTGDTTASERAAMARNPRTFVVTTPESLYLLLTAERSRLALAGVTTVIVDEIHALARDKRGAHLALSLERLQHVVERPLVRVGLSATQRPVETVAALLVGTRTGPDGAPAAVIVDGGHLRALDVALELPGGELEAVMAAGQMDSVLDRIAELVQGHHTTLVFVNTRRMAERLAHQLGERLGDDVVAAHHGSLSRERRQRVEHRLRAGELRALVATASLELGIDIGPVELVCQIGSPRSIATFLQRVGRSNHTRRGTPTGRLFPLTRDELVESTALLSAVRAGRLDAVEPPVAPLDILGQQLVAEVAAAGEWRTDDLYELARRAHHYRGLSRSDFDEVLALAADGVQTARGRRGTYLFHDGINGEVRPRKGARLAALTSGGAIPELGDYRVVLEPDETFIGTVNEDWATESMAGDIFLLGTHSWQIRQVTAGQVRVVDADDRPPTIPFWLGEAPARTVELSAEVSRLREAIDHHLLAGRPDLALAWLADEAGVTGAAAETIVAYLAAARGTLGRLPTQEDLIMERFFDETGGMQLVVHSPWGGRINRAMGYALRKKFCRTFNFELQASATDDNVVISLGPHHSFPLDAVPRYLNSAGIPDTVIQAVLDQPIFLSRWRWNLNRSLLVLRYRGGRRNPPPIQRMEADDLMAALFPDAAACQENVTFPIVLPDHPVVRQTVHDTLTEGLDAEGLAQLWRRIEGGDVRVHCIDTVEPSVLAHEILNARNYAFLDGGEAVDRRTNAVATPRGLPLDPSRMARLEPDAIARVLEEIRPDPAGPDELHDLLAALVVCRPVPAWEGLLAELELRHRAVRRRGPDGDMWHTAEASGDVDTITGGEPMGGARTIEQVAAEVVRGHLELSGPITAGALEERTGLRPGLVAVGLADLESQGFAVQGRFTAPDVAEVEWCSRRLLSRMHSYSRGQRRRGIDPVTPEQLVRFWLRWQHVAPGSQVRGSAGLATVIEQLQGFEVAAAGWEPEVLSRRVADYKGFWLDELCHSGELVWLRLSPPGLDDPDRRGAGASRATPVTLAFRDDLPWLLAGVRGEAVPLPGAGAVREIVDVLAERGACFARELGLHTGRLPTEIEDGLWEAVARGLVSSDGFAAVRALAAGQRRSDPRRLDDPRSRLRRRNVSGGRAAGRWSLVDGLAHGAPDGDEPAAATDLHDLAEAVADQLLARWGIVFFDLVAHEHPALRWRDLQWALRRMEDRGQVIGGRFVNGFSGEQFALPAAVDGLKSIRRLEASDRTVTLSAVDPLNVTGVILPGPRTPARRGEVVELPL